MSVDYWLGVATLPAASFALWFAIGSGQWWRWWFVHNDGRFHGGKGYRHVADYFDLEDRKWWLRGEHTHGWPPDTPWWVIRAAEPARVWLCHRGPDHRPATPARRETEGDA